MRLARESGCASHPACCCLHLMNIESVRKHAMSLPAVTEEPHHHYASFRVRGKIFATIPPEEDVAHVFVGEEVREPALALYPGFIQKLQWAGKVVGLRITLASAKAGVVKSLLDKAYETRVQKETGLKVSRPRKRAPKA